MKVQLPPQIREEVEEVIGPVIKLAQQIYRKRSAVNPGPVVVPRVPAPVINPVPLTLGQGKLREQPPDRKESEGVSRGSGPRPEELWSLGDFQRKLEEVSRPAEKPVFARLRARINGKG